MAEDTTTASPSDAKPSDTPQAAQDGASNTLVLEEDAPTGSSNGAPPLIRVDPDSEGVVVLEDGPSANGPAPTPPPPTNGENVVVVIAERDPATGEVTLVEGKSTGGDGPIRIDGTDRVFEDRARFETFLEDVNGKEDAGVPFEDIIGNDVNAIPVVENGSATGGTLGDLGPFVPPPADASPAPPANGALDEPLVDEVPPVVVIPDGADAGNGFGNTGAPRREPGDGPSPDAGQGNAAEDGPIDIGGFEDANNNGINDVIEPLVGPADGDGADADEPVRQPGRDEDGNLLPGADGQVTLDDFNRINDRDGNGINDGVENPVDLAGNANDEQPEVEPPLLDRIQPELPVFELPGRDQPFEPGGDGTPEPPLRANQPNDDDGLLLGDGLGVIRPELPADLPTDAPVNLPPPAAIPPAAEAAPPPAVATPSADEAPPPPAAPPPTYEVPAAAAVDTFDTGTTPAAITPAPGYTPPPAEHVAVASAGEAPAETAAPDTSAIAAEDCEPGEESTTGLVVPAVAALGTGLAATDVFDAGRIGAAVTTAVAGANDEGGGNLLERIFDKVRDAFFDSGGGGSSPVQLPVPEEIPVPQALVEAPLAEPAPVSALQLEESFDGDDDTPDDDDT